MKVRWIILYSWYFRLKIIGIILEKKLLDPPLELGVGSRISKIEMQHLRTIYCVALHIQILGTEYLFFLQKMGCVSKSSCFFRLKIWWKHENRKFCWVRIEGKDCFEMFWNPKYGWNMFILVRVSRCWMRYFWCVVNGFFELQVYDFDLPPTQDASHHNTFSRESL